MDILSFLEDHVVFIIIMVISVAVTMYSYAGSRIVAGPVVGTDRDGGVGDDSRRLIMIV